MTGAAVGRSVTGFTEGLSVTESVGEIVGAVETTGEGATVGSCTGAIDDATEELDGSSEPKRTSVDASNRGASLQISLPPITEKGAMPEQCTAF